MQSIPRVCERPHLTRCDLRPDGADLRLSGETRRVRFLAACGVPDAGVTALIFLTAGGGTWTGYSLDEETLLHLVVALREAEAPPEPWCTLHLLVPEADVVGVVEFEVD